jgi:hypothetical protein
MVWIQYLLAFDSTSAFDKQGYLHAGPRYVKNMNCWKDKTQIKFTVKNSELTFNYETLPRSQRPTSSFRAKRK